MFSQHFLIPFLKALHDALFDLVGRLTRVAPDVMVLRLQLPANNSFGFRAGQYIEFILIGIVALSVIPIAIELTRQRRRTRRAPVPTRYHPAYRQPLDWTRRS